LTALLVACHTCFALLGAGVHAQQGTQANIDLRIEGGRLTLKTGNVAVGEVLQRIALALDARLSISRDLAARVGQWELHEVPVDEALTQIVHPLNVMLGLESGAAGGAQFQVRQIEVFEAAEADPDRSAQAAAMLAERVREAERTLATDPDADARRMAAMELGDTDSDDRVRLLDKGLGDADVGVRVAVIESLGKIGTDEAIRLVAQAALGAADPTVLSAAIRVLEASASESARVMLLAIKAREQSMPAGKRDSPGPGEPR
jgi:HEAT repeat protein